MNIYETTVKRLNFLEVIEHHFFVCISRLPYALAFLAPFFLGLKLRFPSLFLSLEFSTIIHCKCLVTLLIVPLIFLGWAFETKDGVCSSALEVVEICSTNPPKSSKLSWDRRSLSINLRL